MIAAIAPSSASYDETLSTLRYADQAKKIRTRAVVNEDPTAKMIRELKEELEVLRSAWFQSGRLRLNSCSNERVLCPAARVTGGSFSNAELPFDPTIPPEKQMVRFLSEEGEIRTMSHAALKEQMQTSEKLFKSVNESWEEKIQKTEEARCVENEQLRVGSGRADTEHTILQQGARTGARGARYHCRKGRSRRSHAKAHAAPRQSQRGPAHVRVPGVYDRDMRS